MGRIREPVGDDVELPRWILSRAKRADGTGKGEIATAIRKDTALLALHCPYAIIPYLLRKVKAPKSKTDSVDLDPTAISEWLDDQCGSDLSCGSACAGYKIPRCWIWMVCTIRIEHEIRRHVKHHLDSVLFTRRNVSTAHLDHDHVRRRPKNSLDCPGGVIPHEHRPSCHALFTARRPVTVSRGSALFQSLWSLNRPAFSRAATHEI